MSRCSFACSSRASRSCSSTAAFSAFSFSIAQPTCVLRQTVRRSGSRISTHSIWLPSSSRSRSFSVRSLAIWCRTISAAKSRKSAASAVRSDLDKSCICSKSATRLPKIQRRTWSARNGASPCWPHHSASSARHKSVISRLCPVSAITSSTHKCQAPLYAVRQVPRMNGREIGVRAVPRRSRKQFRALRRCAGRELERRCQVRHGRLGNGRRLRDRTRRRLRGRRSRHRRSGNARAGRGGRFVRRRNRRVRGRGRRVVHVGARSRGSGGRASGKAGIRSRQSEPKPMPAFAAGS